MAESTFDKDQQLFEDGRRVGDGRIHCEEDESAECGLERERRTNAFEVRAVNLSAPSRASSSALPCTTTSAPNIYHYPSANLSQKQEENEP